MARKTLAFETEKNTLATRLRKVFGNETQKDIGKRFGVSNAAVGQWMSGQTNPTIKNLIDISNHYNVSVDYLLGLTDVKSFDIDIRSISQVTGLTEKSINVIKQLNERSPIENIVSPIEALNFIIEEYGYELFVQTAHLLSSTSIIDIEIEDVEQLLLEDKTKAVFSYQAKGLIDSINKYKAMDNDLLSYIFDIRKELRMLSDENILKKAEELKTRITEIRFESIDTDN